jgi:hypothetical protein
MTTQKMYDEGLRCRGRGFNCSTCNGKSNCVEYVNCDPIPKYPLGLTPKHIWQLQRLQEIKDAMNRYSEAYLLIPTEWIQEYNELVKLIEKEGK